MQVRSGRELADLHFHAAAVVGVAAGPVVGEEQQFVAALRRVSPAVRSLRDATRELLDAVRDDVDPVAFRRAVHVVAENRRPEALRHALLARDFASAGALMNDSHASLRDLYEVSSPHLDDACDLARAHPACHGARMTGAGFGGCAVALVERAGCDAFIAAVQPRYESRTYKRSAFFAVAADDGARLEPPRRQER